MGYDFSKESDGNKKENNALFSDESKENKITLIYNIDKPGENIRLFGSKFIKNNKDKCQMIIDFTKMEYQNIISLNKNGKNYM